MCCKQIWNACSLHIFQRGLHGNEIYEFLWFFNDWTIFFTCFNFINPSRLPQNSCLKSILPAKGNSHLFWFPHLGAHLSSCGLHENSKYVYLFVFEIHVMFLFIICFAQLGVSDIVHLCMSQCHLIKDSYTTHVMCITCDLIGLKPM